MPGARALGARSGSRSFSWGCRMLQEPVPSSLLLLLTVGTEREAPAARTAESQARGHAVVAEVGARAERQWADSLAGSERTTVQTRTSNSNGKTVMLVSLLDPGTVACGSFWG